MSKLQKAGVIFLLIGLEILVFWLFTKIEIEKLFSNPSLIILICFSIVTINGLIMLVVIIFNKYTKKFFPYLLFITLCLSFISSIIDPEQTEDNIPPTLNIENCLSMSEIFVENPQKQINSKSILGSCVANNTWAYNNDLTILERIEYKEYNPKLEMLENIIKNKEELPLIEEKNSVKLYRKDDRYMFVKGDTIIIITSAIELDMNYVFENF